MSDRIVKGFVLFVATLTFLQALGVWANGGPGAHFAAYMALSLALAQTIRPTARRRR